MLSKINLHLHVYGYVIYMFGQKMTWCIIARHQFWLVLYNQADFVSVLKKHLVIGQSFRSRF